MTEANQGSIYYEVDVQTDKLLTGTQAATASLDAITKSSAKTDTAVKSLGTSSGRTANEMRPLAVAIKAANSEAVYGATAFGKLSAVMGGFLGIGAAQYAIHLAESYGEMSERIQMATKNSEEYEMVQSRLLATAQATYRPLSEAQELFVRTSAALTSLGYTTSQALDITDSLSLAFVKNATSTDRANNAISAYSKALQKGKVEADGWESVTSAIPTIVEDIAKASGKSAAAIRELGASGKLSARDLNEGLRQSLDANKEAAAGMAVTVKDAFNNLRNSLSVYLGEANKANGATGLIASSIGILSENISTFASLLIAVGSGALTGYIASLGLAAVAAVKANLATQQRAAGLLNEARAEAAATAVTLARAQAYAKLGAGAAALTAAETAHAAALGRVAVAQTAVMGVGRMMLGVLGGPIGIIALVATAAAGFVAFGNDARAASPGVEALLNTTKELTKVQQDLRKIQLNIEIAKQTALYEAADSEIRALTLSLKMYKNLSEESVNIKKDKITIQREQAEAAAIAIKNLNSALRDMDDAKKPTVPDGKNDAPEQQSSTKGRERIAELKDELAALKATGAERAKLKELSKLDGDATDAEKAAVAALADEIYRLEAAEKAAEKATTDRTQAEKQNADTIKDLRDKIELLRLSGDALGEAKARQKLNEFATQEEIEQAKALGKELQNLEELAKRRAKFGDTEHEAKKEIVGNVTPLSGGGFDDQTARYDAEAKTENERYAEQLERLKAAKELQIAVEGGYLATEEEMHKTHAARMAQIEQAKNDAMLSAGAQGFGALADLTRTFAGEQSSAYKTLFGISKAFNIAQSTMAVLTAIANASASGPFPANLAAMATVASATAGLVSSISSVSMGGGRQYGGPVAAGGAYRVNENGAPEIFNAANGQQYMLPNTRGEVVSNGTASGSGSIINNISITVDSAGGSSVTQGAGGGQDANALAGAIKSVVVDELERQSRQGGVLWRMQNNG